jgi:Fe-S-cluster containining protein
MSHPCQSCGACCAAYRVSFHWFEAEPAMGAPGIPAQLTEPMDPHRLVMRGTWAPQPRCVALQGEVGTHAHCSIYPQRPSPCRELQASWENGVQSPQCDKARARHGLPPLTPADWQRDAA